MRPRHKFILTLSMLLTLCFGSSAIARADTIILNAIQAGWYTDTGSNNGPPQNFNQLNNYFAGRTSNGELHRNYFVFNLAYITGVTSAEVHIHNLSGSDFFNHDPFEVYTVYDVITPPGDLGGVSSIAVYDDLGSGTIYGSVSVPYSFDANDVVFSLNAAAIQAIQNSGGLFVIGGAITSLDPNRTAAEGLFVLMDDVQLVLQGQHVPVPEPATLVLLGTGLMGVAAKVRRKRRNADPAKLPD